MGLYGGIEGGQTLFKCVIVDETGNTVSSCASVGLNISIAGIDKLIEVIDNLTKNAKRIADIDPETPLDSLGLCLSGVESERLGNEITKKVIEKGNISTKVVTTNDLFAAGLACGGNRELIFLLISGTGSNSGVMFKGSMITTTGGSGFLLGEKGSAFWLSQKVLKIVTRYLYEIEIEYEYALKEDITELVYAARIFFNFVSISQLIDSIYSNYNIDRIASFSKKICQLAMNGNRLCIRLVELIGKHQAILLISNIRKLRSYEKIECHEITVLCIGSVWKSWVLFKDMFMSVLATYEPHVKPKMVKFRDSPVLGSVLLAAPDEVIIDHQSLILPLENQFFD